jgi:hypothetical protein
MISINLADSNLLINAYCAFSDVRKVIRDEMKVGLEHDVCMNLSRESDESGHINIAVEFNLAPGYSPSDGLGKMIILALKKGCFHYGEHTISFSENFDSWWTEIRDSSGNRYIVSCLPSSVLDESQDASNADDSLQEGSGAETVQEHQACS